ncbi:hypothetical protein OF117_20270, partial [Geodermatophilus sp. YIM 151500]|nr:hypothetical protein [Geodermatophilus sp. YIM 151500]
SRLGRPPGREDGSRSLSGSTSELHGTDGGDGPVAVAWPAQHVDGAGPGEPGEVDPPAPRMPRTDDGPGDGGAR